MPWGFIRIVSARQFWWNPRTRFQQEIGDNFAPKSFVNWCSACIQVHVLALAEIVILKKLSAPFSGHQVRFKESFVSALREFMDSTGSGLDSRKRHILYNTVELQWLHHWWLIHLSWLELSSWYLKVILCNNHPGWLGLSLARTILMVQSLFEPLKFYCT